LTGPAKIEWIDLGLIGYDEAFAVQAALHERWKRDEGLGTILFQENPHVITLGRWACADNLLVSQETLEQRGVIIRNVSRGGDVTYHGPGQLVISPILKLREMALGVHQYVRLLEQVVINLLATCGITSDRVDGATGVWLGNKKIAAVGIAVKSGITQHGVAINVCPDLSYFDFIIPCGLLNKGVTSMQAQGIGALSLQQVRSMFLSEFSKTFGVEIVQDQLFPGRKESCCLK
jgi:lipoate-protein ligase B